MSNAEQNMIAGVSTAPEEERESHMREVRLKQAAELERLHQRAALLELNTATLSQGVAQALRAPATFAGKLDLLEKLYAAMPGLQRAGVRKLEATEHGFVVELDRVEQPDSEPEPADPVRGDDLDTAHVD